MFIMCMVCVTCCECYKELSNEEDEQRDIRGLQITILCVAALSSTLPQCVHKSKLDSTMGTNSASYLVEPEHLQ